MLFQTSTATLAKRTKVVRKIHRLRAIGQGLIRPKTVRPYTIESAATRPENNQSAWDIVQEEVLTMQGIPACFGTCERCGERGLVITGFDQDEAGQEIGGFDRCVNGCKKKKI